MQKEKPEKYPIDNLIGIEYRKLEKQFSVSQNNLINLAYLLKKAKLLSPISQEAVKLEENIQQKISAIKNSILQEKLLKLQTASGQTSNIYALEKLKRNAEQIKEQIEEHREFSSVLPSYNAFSAAMQTKILSCLNKQPYNSRNSGPPFLIIGITLSLVLAFSAFFLLKEYIKSPNKQEQKFEYKQTEQTKTSEIPSVQSYTPISEEHKAKINI
ncbi:hypothetical protein HZB88_02075, partial [archaeon]|nr:hypothetical protein [archaeon]